MLIKKISPTCLSALKKKFTLTHIVMWCKSEEGQYIVTTGNTPDNTVQAAILGNKFRDYLGWPKMSFAIAPKLSELLLENKRLAEENIKLKQMLGSLQQADGDKSCGE